MEEEFCDEYTKMKKIKGKFKVTQWNHDRDNSSFEGTTIRGKGLLYLVFGERFKLGKPMKNGNTCFDHLSYGITLISPPACKIGVLIDINYNSLRKLYDGDKRVFECEYILP